MYLKMSAQRLIGDEQHVDGALAEHVREEERRDHDANIDRDPGAEQDDDARQDVNLISQRGAATAVQK